MSVMSRKHRSSEHVLLCDDYSASFQCWGKCSLPVGQLIQIYCVMPPEEVLLLFIKKQLRGCVGINFIFPIITKCSPLLEKKVMNHQTFLFLSLRPCATSPSVQQEKNHQAKLNFNSDFLSFFYHEAVKWNYSGLIFFPQVSPSPFSVASFGVQIKRGSCGSASFQHSCSKLLAEHPALSLCFIVLPQ